MYVPSLVLHASPNGVSTLRFANLLARLLEQVCTYRLIQRCILMNECSLCYRENMRHFRFYTLWQHRPGLPRFRHKLYPLLSRLHLLSNQVQYQLLWFQVPLIHFQEEKLKLTYLENTDLDMVSDFLLYHKVIRWNRIGFTGRAHLPELFLLRDTLYLLQGISGKYVSFMSTAEAAPGEQLVFRENSVSLPSILIASLRIDGF